MEIQATDPENYWQSKEWTDWIASNGIWKGEGAQAKSIFYDKHMNQICNTRTELYEYYRDGQAWHWSTVNRSGLRVQE